MVLTFILNFILNFNNTLVSSTHTLPLNIFTWKIPEGETLRSWHENFLILI